MNTHAIVTLGRKQLPGELRIGVVLANRVEVWKEAVLRALAEEPAIHLEVIFLNNTSKPAGPPRLWQVYERWSSQANDPFGRLDTSPILRDVPRVKGELLDDHGQLTAQAHHMLASSKLDLLFWMGEPPQGGECSGIARFGLWRFSAGNPAHPIWSPPYFREALERDQISEFLILAHVKDFNEAIVTYRYASATTEGWHLGRNAKDILDRAGVFLLRRLLDLIQFGPDWLTEQAGSAIIRCRDAKPKYPSSSVLLRYLGRQVVRSLRLRYRRRGRNTQWFTAVRWNQELFSRHRTPFSDAGLHPIAPNPGWGEADPFLLERDGHHFLFFEESSNAGGRGRIAFRELRQDFSSTPPIPILEPPYHISYPFLIKSSGELFMMPETSENNTVELYRCTEFPHQWRLEKVLCEGVALVDTTPFFCENTWFFFTTSFHSGELLLFYSERLDGEWHYHRANPISSDVRNNRAAGALFRRGNSLIRPAQDGSAGYGYAITLNEVAALSRSEYAEKLIETISPTWSKGLLGTHTINATDHAEVMDGLRYCE